MTIPTMLSTPIARSDQTQVPILFDLSNYPTAKAVQPSLILVLVNDCTTRAQVSELRTYAWNLLSANGWNNSDFYRVVTDAAYLIEQFVQKGRQLNSASLQLLALQAIDLNLGTLYVRTPALHRTSTGVTSQHLDTLHQQHTTLTYQKESSMFGYGYPISQPTPYHQPFHPQATQAPVQPMHPMQVVAAPYTPAPPSPMPEPTMPKLRWQTHPNQPYWVAYHPLMEDVQYSFNGQQVVQTMVPCDRNTQMERARHRLAHLQQPQTKTEIIGTQVVRTIVATPQENEIELLLNAADYPKDICVSDRVMVDTDIESLLEVHLRQYWEIPQETRPPHYLALGQVYRPFFMEELAAPHERALANCRSFVELQSVLANRGILSEDLEDNPIRSMFDIRHYYQAANELMTEQVNMLLHHRLSHDDVAITSFCDDIKELINHVRTQYADLYWKKFLDFEIRMMQQFFKIKDEKGPVCQSFFNDTQCDNIAFLPVSYSMLFVDRNYDELCLTFPEREGEIQRSSLIDVERHPYLHFLADQLFRLKQQSGQTEGTDIVITADHKRFKLYQGLLVPDAVLAAP